MTTLLDTFELQGLSPLVGESAPLPQRMEKPWGHELLWACSTHYAAKILHIREGCRLSLQYHRVKQESLLLLRGRLALELEAANGNIEQHEVAPGQIFHIAPGQRHRLGALQTCDVLEVSTPELDDVVRLQDDFNRA